MDASSLRLENESKLECLSKECPNDDDLTENDDDSSNEDDLVNGLDDIEELDDRADNGTLNDMIDEDDKVEEPKISMTFTSKETLIAYYKKYAKETGFALIKRGIKKMDDIVYYLSLTCSREGKPRKSRVDATKTAPTKTVPTTIGLF